MNATAAWNQNGGFDEKNISYDVNGNILTLQRNAILSGSVSAVDDLNYSYDGNRLSNVSDGTGGNYGLFGFKNLTGSTAAYSYAENGNLISDPKKGLSLSYNKLNRTERMVITTATGRYIDYTYDADGGLLRKQAFDKGSLVKTTDYIGGFVYENNVLSHFGMAEGRVRNSSGTFTLEYMIKDHQGNVRVSFESQNGVAVVRQENSYYPFGLNMPGSVLPTMANQNLYNGGSEWQNDFDNLPDLQHTFYRMYDAALGRFIAADPMAEASESMTSYHYGLNNPVLFNDPLGDQAKMTMYDIINTISAHDKGYGGRWSSSNPDNVFTFTNNMEGFAFVTDRLDQYGGWETTYAGNFETAWGNLNGNISATGFRKEIGLRGVDIKETRSNVNWLIERLNESTIRKDMTATFNKQIQSTNAYFSNIRHTFDSFDPVSRATLRLALFVQLVKAKAPYDLKAHGYSLRKIGRYSIYEGQTFRNDDYGNYNYGVAAKRYSNDS